MSEEKITMLNGKKYKLGALNLKQLEKYRELIFVRMPNFRTVSPWDAMFDMVPVIGDSIRVYSPDVTDDQLKEWLTLDTVFQTFNQVLEANFLKLIPLEGNNAGESKPAQVPN